MTVPPARQCTLMECEEEAVEPENPASLCDVHLAAAQGNEGVSNPETSGSEGKCQESETADDDCPDVHPGVFPEDLLDVEQWPAWKETDDGRKVPRTPYEHRGWPEEFVTVAEGTPDELLREPEKSIEELADVETTSASKTSRVTWTETPAASATSFGSTVRPGSPIVSIRLSGNRAAIRENRYAQSPLPGDGGGGKLFGSNILPRPRGSRRNDVSHLSTNCPCATGATNR